MNEAGRRGPCPLASAGQSAQEFADLMVIGIVNFIAVHLMGNVRRPNSRIRGRHARVLDQRKSLPVQ